MASLILRGRYPLHVLREGRILATLAQNKPLDKDFQQRLIRQRRLYSKDNATAQSNPKLQTASSTDFVDDIFSEKQVPDPLNADSVDEADIDHSSGDSIDQKDSELTDDSSAKKKPKSKTTHLAKPSTNMVKPTEKVDFFDFNEVRTIKETMSGVIPEGNLGIESAYFNDQITEKLNKKTVGELHDLVKHYMMDTFLNYEAKQQVLCKVIKAVRRVEPSKEFIASETFELIKFFIVENVLVDNMEKPLLFELLDLHFETVGREENLFGESLVRELKERANSLNIKHLSTVIGILKHRTDTYQNQQLMEALRYCMKHHLAILSTPEDLLTCMYSVKGVIGEQQTELLDPLIRKALVIIEVMSPSDLYKLLYFIARNRLTSCSALVRGVCAKLREMPLHLEKDKYRNLFFSCVVLNITDQRLLMAMSDGLVEQFSDNTEKTDFKFVGSHVLKSCAMLGWKHDGLINSIMGQLREEVFFGNISQADKVNILCAIGKLNLLEHKDLAKELLADFQELKQLHPDEWLKIVKHMSVIGLADVQMVKEVLEPSFYRAVIQFAQGKSPYHRQEVQTALMELVGYLNIQMGDPYTLPEMASWQTQLHDKMKERSLVGFMKVVGDTLQMLAPLGSYTNTNVISKYGHVIDFEFFVNEEGMAVHQGPDVKETRVWMKVLKFKDYIHGNAAPCLSGSSQRLMDQLLAENKHTIFISYLEWMTKKTNFAKLDYLNKQIRACVGVAEKVKPAPSDPEVNPEPNIEDLELGTDSQGNPDTSNTMQ